MEYTIINNSDEKLILTFHSIPFRTNKTNDMKNEDSTTVFATTPKRKNKDYDIPPRTTCKVGFPSYEGTLFKLMGTNSVIEFEYGSDKKIHFTHVSRMSYKFDSDKNVIELDTITHA